MKLITHHQLSGELIELEAALRDLDMWHGEVPSAAELASVEPFACDTLVFTQWLQFLFIPRLQNLAQAGLPLPGQCAVAPMAEEYFKAGRHGARPVIAILKRIDGLLTTGHLTQSS